MDGSKERKKIDLKNGRGKGRAMLLMYNPDLAYHSRRVFLAPKSPGQLQQNSKLLFFQNLSPKSCAELSSQMITIAIANAMAPHSSTFAWKIPWMEEPGRLQSMGSLRVGHDWATSLSLFTFLHWRRKWQPTPVFLLGESQGWGSWWAAVYGVAQSRTRLKWLSSSIANAAVWYSWKLLRQ